MAIAESLRGMIARGVLMLVDAGRKLQSVQMRLTAGEVKGGLEHFEPYGFTSHPKAGAEGIVFFLGGDRSHGAVICLSDRRFRLKALEPGEVALYSDEGDSIVFKRGRVVEVTTETYRVNANRYEVIAPGGMQFTAPTLDVSGRVAVAEDLTVGNISFKVHGHKEVKRGDEVSGGPV